VPGNDWQSEIGRLQRSEHSARTILGVSEDADRAEIRRAFRRASLAHHTDRNPGDADSAPRFHLICCAYKFLTECEACTALDEPEYPSAVHTDGKYGSDNPWGYWCWWRDKYSGNPLPDKEEDDADFRVSVPEMRSREFVPSARAPADDRAPDKDRWRIAPEKVWREVVTVLQCVMPEGNGDLFSV